MENRTFITLSDKYFDRFGYQTAKLTKSVSNNTKLIVVIPCYNELNLLESLSSLVKSKIPKNTSIEVITVINHGVNASDKIKSQNIVTVNDSIEFSALNSNSQIQFLTLKAFDLPKKHAGVGLARKIGMDEALYRFQSINEDGIIVCFDADSKCEENYFEIILNEFRTSETNGASIHFEHPTSGEESSEIYNAIIDYELHLRYYKNAIRFTGAPYGYHTIGSSMAVRASAYAKQGGMNKRKAGEDFYFLSKIIQLGNFKEISTTKVIPSPRVSDRVPFGTGKAVGDIIATKNEEYKTYSFEAFKDIKHFFSQIDSLYSNIDYSLLPHSIQLYISKLDFKAKIEEIKSNTKSLETFKQRFFFVFDAFWILKFVHYYRDNIKENQNLFNETLKLLHEVAPTKTSLNNNKKLLYLLRKVDKL